MPLGAQKQALLALLKSLSYEERPVTLSSGATSTFYIDCKQTVLTGAGHLLVGGCFLALLGEAEAEQPHPTHPTHPT